MAFYIRIEKIEENSLLATYKFTSGHEASGTFSLNKKTGRVTLIKEMPDDSNQNIYRRASIKILREWRNGILPEITEWAS